MNVRVLSGNDVRQAITMAGAIQAVKEGYVQLSAGQAVVPLRPPHPGLLRLPPRIRRPLR